MLAGVERVPHLLLVTGPVDEREVRRLQPGHLVHQLQHRPGHALEVLAGRERRRHVGQVHGGPPPPARPGAAAPPPARPPAPVRATRPRVGEHLGDVLADGRRAAPRPGRSGRAATSGDIAQSTPATSSPTTRGRRPRRRSRTPRRARAGPSTGSALGVRDQRPDVAGRHQVADRLLRRHRQQVAAPGQRLARDVRDHPPAVVEPAHDRRPHVELLHDQRERAGDPLVPRAPPLRSSDVSSRRTTVAPVTLCLFGTSSRRVSAAGGLPPARRRPAAAGRVRRHHALWTRGAAGGPPRANGRLRIHHR